MGEPRLRTVNKAVAPFEMNRFPAKFVDAFAREIVYMMATKQSMSLEGNEWEQIFASCIGAKWKPSNVGLDDVILDNCCWSAKTVFAGSKDIARQDKVRLVSGRNSLKYSFGVDGVEDEDPNEIGKMVLDIWNERVSGIRQYFKFARTVVLVKAKDFSEFLIFELDTVRYDSDLYCFEWNKNQNLEGYHQETGVHKFTWQPSGSQFTIVEEIPSEKMHIRVKRPEKVDKDALLKTLNFDSSWYSVIQ